MLLTLLCFCTSGIAIALATYYFRGQPLPLLLLAFLSLGGPVKALLYDLGMLRKNISVYPYSLTEINGAFALADTLIVIAFVAVWCKGAPRLNFKRFASSLRPGSLAVFVIFVGSMFANALSTFNAIGIDSTAHRGNQVTANPLTSFIFAETPIWPLATVVLMYATKSRVARAAIAAVYCATAVLGSNYGRAGLIGFAAMVLVAWWDDLSRKQLIAALALVLAVAGGVGALTRGNEDFSADKVMTQTFADLQFLDQSVSYFALVEGEDLLAPRSTAFFDSFAYGYIPRFLYPEKPTMYGNSEVQFFISPVVAYNADKLERHGFAGGFFPVSLWVELFYNFGVPFGLMGLMGIALGLNWALRSSASNVLCFVASAALLGSAHGLFRGGSNWLMTGPQSAIPFLLLNWALSLPFRRTLGLHAEASV